MQSCSCSCSMAFGRDGARSRFGRGRSKRRFVYIGLVGFEPFRLGMAVNLAARRGEQFVVASEDERELGTAQLYVEQAFHFMAVLASDRLLECVAGVRLIENNDC